MGNKYSKHCVKQKIDNNTQIEIYLRPCDYLEFSPTDFLPKLIKNTSLTPDMFVFDDWYVLDCQWKFIGKNDDYLKNRNIIEQNIKVLLKGKIISNIIY